MRILYDHQVFSLQNAGGVSRYHYELMRHLAREADVKQELFLGLHQSQLPFEALASENVRLMGRRTALRPGGKRYLINEALGNAYAATHGRFDIYHPTHHRYMPMVRARRMVATHHDCTQERFKQQFRYSGVVLRSKPELFARADAILCVSESSRQDLLHFYDVDPARTRVVHHGFTRLERSPQGADQLRRHVRRDFLLHVGSRAAYKNFDGLLRAFHDTGLYQSLDLLILGGGALKPEHQALAAELGVAGSLVAVPLASDAMLAEAYARARALAYPSLWEGFGFPPLEAMYLGCPVVACRCSAIPEVCGDAPFYFEPENPGSLAEALLRVLQDEPGRSFAIDLGRAVAQKYTWEQCAQQTLTVYRELLGEVSGA